VARFLSGSPAAIEQVPGVPAASVTHRLKLTGVVAEGANRGYALIAIDGKPSKPFRVGTSVTEDLILFSVAPRSAFLANRVEGPVTMTLDLPQLSKP
jgi:general secretion pathway protein C